jgi:prepilin-type N-terminal cleavage/methylation domain-containing protein
MGLVLKNMARAATRIPRQATRERGFTLIEVIIAMLILVIGLVSLLGVFSQALVAVSFAQEDMIAKQKVREALESIYTARNTQAITFDQIKSVSAGGIFLEGMQPLRLAGADGLIGTADDGAIEELRLPGPDGLLATADDEVRTLTNFRRQISFDPVIIGAVASGDIRRLTVTVQYTTARGFWRRYQVQSYISRFR